MIQYPLQAFLRVCKMREEQRQRELVKARQATLEAQEALEKAVEEHTKFKENRPHKEKKLFAEIKGEVVSQERLDAFHLDVKKLLDTELALAAAVDSAKAHLQHAQKQEQEALRQWQEATKEHTKITEHQNIWKNSQRIQQERAEEAEMEGA